MAKKLFVKGQSGNPKGKPKGVRNSATQISYALLEGNLQDVLNVLLDKAKNGDVNACKMIIDKVLPNSKDRTLSLELPLIHNINGVGDAQAEVLRLVSVGGISPSEGERVASIIEARRRTFESIELEARISRLEAQK